MCGRVRDNKDNKVAMFCSICRRAFGNSVLAGALLLLTACGFEAPSAKRTAPPQTPPPALSTLSAMLTIPAFDIARLLNDKTADHIIDLHDQPVKCAIGRCRLTLNAVRTSAIIVQAHDGALQIAVPFTTHAELTLPGFLSVLKANANARGQSVTTTMVKLGPDWQVRPSTSGTIQLENSHLRLGPLVTNLADVWNENEHLLSHPLFKMLDSKIAAGLHERPRIAKWWDRAFVPMKIAKNPAAWLLLQPEHLRVGLPVTANDAITLSLGVDVRAHVVVQDEVPVTNPVALPPPMPLRQPANRFAFVVPVLLPYGQAARLALKIYSTKSRPISLGLHCAFQSSKLFRQVRT